jgi:hypothetical protein
LAVTDYDAMRKNMAATFDGKVAEVRDLVAKLQKTQRAAEQTLEKYACEYASCSQDALTTLNHAGMRNLAPRDGGAFRIYIK